MREAQVYEVELDATVYQVEVELLENTPEYLHVALSVDDGRLPESIVPASRSIVIRKPTRA